MRKILFLILIGAALGSSGCDTRQEDALEARVDAVRDSADIKAETMEMPLDSVSTR
ncbi:hypothetical protein HNQ93_003228 [Hymenobacter luteus]|uniref:Uncharacterized protein n=2 Tax=Hymenobacter TaxID=89966 RepID=A0A7W9T2F9_9BACT|nr:hypothetical protein [Hymenobacter latericoloratus]MBB6060362.1 hypothetical protein [Hymenobacter luteus]